MSNDERRQFTLLNDRSQGGSSLSDGQLELMLHRRTMYDDFLGVEEALNERVNGQHGLVVKGIVSMLFDTVTQSAHLHRDLAHQIYNKPLVTFSLNNDPGLVRLAGMSMLAKPLPTNLHLLTLAPDYSLDLTRLHSTPRALIVRIEHFYEKDEDSTLSQATTVNLREVFSKSFNLVGVEELALGANMASRELDERLEWKSSESHQQMINEMFEYKSRRDSQYFDNDRFTFTFNPMQIRTFRLYIS